MAESCIYRAIEWRRHAKTTIVVDDVSCPSGFRVIAEAEEVEDAQNIVAALNAITEKEVPRG